MKIRIAAATPDIRPGDGQGNKVNIISIIERAKADKALLLCLPDGCVDGLRGDESLVEEIRRSAGALPVYPITRAALTAKELPKAKRQDLMLCAADLPATASSQFEVPELAARVSHDKRCAVAIACPLGGEAGDFVYDGRCVIAQNGFILAQGTEYVASEVDSGAVRVKKPITATCETSDLPQNPWVPFPDMLERAMELQSRALARRMESLRQTRISVPLDGSPDSLLALAASARALKSLSLPPANLHAAVNGLIAEAAAVELGASMDIGEEGLEVGTDDLTRLALGSGAQAAVFDCNAGMPETVVRLALRSTAAVCGNRRLGAALRESLEAYENPDAELYDFFLYYLLRYGCGPKILLRLTGEVFARQYESAIIKETLKEFYHRYFTERTLPPLGPAVFGLSLHTGGCNVSAEMGKCWINQLEAEE
jgi:hypothetical protein